MKRIILKAPTGSVFLGDSKLDIKNDYDKFCLLDGIDCQDDFSEYSDLSHKLNHGYMSFKLEGDVFYTITEFSVKEDLTPDEINELVEETQGQWSDGIGEGFEQTPCTYIDGEEVYICPWFYGQKIEVNIVK